jgi:hypothetical protein
VDKKWLISCIFPKKGLLSVQEGKASLEKVTINLHPAPFLGIKYFDTRSILGKGAGSKLEGQVNKHEKRKS